MKVLVKHSIPLIMRMFKHSSHELVFVGIHFLLNLKKTLLLQAYLINEFHFI